MMWMGGREQPKFEETYDWYENIYMSACLFVFVQELVCALTGVPGSIHKLLIVVHLKVIRTPKHLPLRVNK